MNKESAALNNEEPDIEALVLDDKTKQKVSATIKPPEKKNNNFFTEENDSVPSEHDNQKESTVTILLPEKADEESEREDYVKGITQKILQKAVS